MEERKFTYYNDNPDLEFKEYGRHVYKMVQHLMEVDDLEKRSSMAAALVELMRRLNPASPEDTDEENHKIWDHLYIMSGYKLEVNAPFPLPDPKDPDAAQKPMVYPDSHARFKHYGKNVDLLVQEAIAMEDTEEKENAIVYLGRLMKSFYTTWNKENVDDTLILDQIDILSKGELKISAEKVRTENLFDSPIKEWKSLPGNAGQAPRTFIRRVNADKKRKK